MRQWPAIGGCTGCIIICGTHFRSGQKQWKKVQTKICSAWPSFKIIVILAFQRCATDYLRIRCSIQSACKFAVVISKNLAIFQKFQSFVECVIWLTQKCLSFYKEIESRCTTFCSNRRKWIIYNSVTKYVAHLLFLYEMKGHFGKEILGQLNTSILAILFSSRFKFGERASQATGPARSLEEMAKLSIVVEDYRTLEHKNGCSFETRSNRIIHMKFFHCFCVPCSFMKWVPHVMIRPVVCVICARNAISRWIDNLHWLYVWERYLT